MSRLVFLLVTLTSCLATAQPKQAVPVASVQYVSKAVYDSMQYRNQQDIEGLKRDLAAYKDLSFKAMDTSGTHLNIFILAVVALLVILGYLNFRVSDRERKNLEESLERQFEDKIKQHMNQILEDYEVIKRHSAAMIASREEDKKTLKAELEEFSKSEVKEFTNKALEKIASELEYHKKAFAEEMATLHLLRMEPASKKVDLWQFLSAFKSYIAHSKEYDSGSKHSHTKALEYLSEMLKNVDFIRNSEKQQIRDILETEDLFDEQAKALVLKMLGHTRELKAFSSLGDANGKLKELLVEKEGQAKIDDGV